MDSEKCILSSTHHDYYIIMQIASLSLILCHHSPPPLEMSIDVTKGGIERSPGGRSQKVLLDLLVWGFWTSIWVSRQLGGHRELKSFQQGWF